MGIPATPAAPSEQDSLGALITRLGVDLARIVRAEVGLLGMRLVAAVDVLRTVTVSMVAGVVLATTGFGLTMLAVVFLLARWLPPWAAALIVGNELLSGKVQDENARFLVRERHLGTASLTGANGLYSVAVLVATLGLPASATLTRGLGVLTFVAGLVLAGAGLTGDPRHVMVGTALTIPLFLAWSLAASSSPHPR